MAGKRVKRNRVFISYRRFGGAELARTVKEALHARGYDVFFDVEDLNEAGPFPEKLRHEVESAASVVVILSPGSLDRCLRSEESSEDWFRQEIAHALRLGKKVVPVITGGFSWPSQPLPPDIAPLRLYQGLTPSHEYFDAGMDRLAELLGRSSLPKSKWIFAAVGAAVLLLALGLAYFFINEHSQRSAHDQYVGVALSKSYSGTLLSDENYVFDLELENRTSMPIEITRVVIDTINAKAARLFRRPEDRVHTSDHQVLMHMEPHEKKAVTIKGGPVLPMAVIIKVFHSLSGEESRFELNLGSVLQEMPQARVLPDSVFSESADALVAIKKAGVEAGKWKKDAHLVATFPGDNKVAIEPATRLRYVIAESWIATFYSPSQGLFFTAQVNGNDLKFNVYAKEASEQVENCTPSSSPQIGDQEAIKLVSAKHLICGNWHNTSLTKVTVDGECGYAWFVPYLGPDSLPLVVDAVHGSLLGLDKDGKGFTRSSSLR
jgi:hypothetical protein